MLRGTGLVLAVDKFLDFARSHGLLLDYVSADGRVHRVPTLAKPKRRNGAYAYDGARGFVQDWTVHPTAIPYRGTSITPSPVRQKRAQGARRDAEAATHLARQIIARSAFQPHPYLARKGFPTACGLVDPDDDRLIVPMYDATDYKRLLTVQRIAEDGTKLFLRGGTAKDAVHHLGRGSADVLVEGYATGLSVRAAMAALYRDCRVIVCFSAGNLAHVARLYPRAFVVADNDRSHAGELAARQSGLRYVMPAQVGDANDLHAQEGLPALMALLR